MTRDLLYMPTFRNSLFHDLFTFSTDLVAFPLTPMIVGTHNFFTTLFTFIILVLFVDNMAKHATNVSTLQSVLTSFTASALWGVIEIFWQFGKYPYIIRMVLTPKLQGVSEKLLSFHVYNYLLPQF